MVSGDTDAEWLKRIKVVRDIYAGIAESNANVYVGEQILSSLVYKFADSVHPTVPMAKIAFRQVLDMQYRNKKLRGMLVVVDATLTPDSIEKEWTRTVGKELFDDEVKLFYIINYNGLYANSTQQILYSNTLAWNVMTSFNRIFGIGRFGWDDGITFTLDGSIPLDEQIPAAEGVQF